MTMLRTIPDLQGSGEEFEVLPELVSSVSYSISCTPISINPSLQGVLSKLSSGPLGSRDFFMRMPIVFSETAGWEFGANREQRLLSFTSWVLLPEPDASAEAVASIGDQLQEILQMTSWSQRDLAQVLQTSHTTVRKLLLGGSVSARSMSIASRVRPVYDIVSRLHLVAQRDSTRLAVALTSLRDDGKSAVDLLAGGEDNAAYTTAIKALRGRQEGSRDRPRKIRPADATVELS